MRNTRNKDMPHGRGNYLYQPPDGGFGWVVVAASFASSLLHFTYANSFPLMYLVYQAVFKSSKAVTGLIGSLQLFAFGFVGIIAGTLTDRLGFQLVAIIGAIMVSTGCFLSAFAFHISWLFLTHGLLIGPGIGLTYTCGSAVVQKWFTARRPLAAGIAILGLQVGNTLSGPLTYLLNTSYGWRETLLIYSAITLPVTIAADFFQKPPSSLTDQDMDFEDVSAPLIDVPSTTNYVDKPVWKNLKFVIFSLGNILSTYGNLVLLLHTPSRAKHYGMSMTQIQIIPTLSGICQCLGGLIGGVAGNICPSWLVVNFALAAGCGGVVTTALVLTDNKFLPLAVLISLASVLIGLCFSTRNTVLTELVGVSQISRAIGGNLLALSVPLLTAVPLAGWMYDVTGDYNIPYYVMGGMQVAGGIMLGIIPAKLQSKPTATVMDRSAKVKVTHK